MIEQLAARGSAQDDQLLLPWVIFTAGAMGAGKGYVTRWMGKQGYLPMQKFVVVDPDQIRQMLPEWPGYVERDAENAGRMTQKEAGKIAEILGYTALRDRKNVIFDGSLRDARWYTKYFRDLRSRFPGVRIMIIHILADKDEVLVRAAKRAEETGRVVPREELLSSMEAVPRSVVTLAPHADFVIRVLNVAGQEPQLQREPQAPFPRKDVALSWEFITKLWQRLDTTRSGSLTGSQIEAAISAGLLTHAVVDSIDKDGDGAISSMELDAARRIAHRNANVTKFVLTRVDTSVSSLK